MRRRLGQSKNLGVRQRITRLVRGQKYLRSLMESGVDVAEGERMTRSSTSPRLLCQERGRASWTRGSVEWEVEGVVHVGLQPRRWSLKIWLVVAGCQDRREAGREMQRSDGAVGGTSGPGEATSSQHLQHSSNQRVLKSSTDQSIDRGSDAPSFGGPFAFIARRGTITPKAIMVMRD
jgi:hypothetical protein